MVFIGICGKMGSGKDYIAKNFILPILKNMNRNPLQLSFADQLKVNVMHKYNLTFNECYIEKNERSRNFLQIEGTQNGRDKMGEDIWIKYTHKWSEIFKERGFDTFVITDCRFKNEVNYIKNNNGLLIKIIAQERNKRRLVQESNNNLVIYYKLQNHKSECDLDDLDDNQFDLIINNDKADDKLNFIELEKIISDFLKSKLKKN
jgi:hypothetical protein